MPPRQTYNDSTREAKKNILAPTKTRDRAKRERAAKPPMTAMDIAMDIAYIHCVLAWYIYTGKGDLKRERERWFGKVYCVVLLWREETG
jgi:hypothetical protein